jgi:hypothetical protein
MTKKGLKMMTNILMSKRLNNLMKMKIRVKVLRKMKKKKMMRLMMRIWKI